MEAVSAVIDGTMEGISKGQAPKSIPKFSKPQSDYGENTLLPTPPRVKPEYFPDDVFRHFLPGDGYEEAYHAVWTYLEGYKKRGGSWEEYIVKAGIPMVFREKMARIFAECRRNGFFSPTAGNSKGKKVIMFRQLVSPRDEKPKPNHLEWKRCDLCERNCPSKDWAGVWKDLPPRCGTMNNNQVTISG